MVAGYDTTANTLTFASYSLATNPDVQDKLIEEIDREIADVRLYFKHIMYLVYVILLGCFSFYHPSVNLCFLEV